MGKLFLLQRLSNGHYDPDTEVVRDSIDYLLWRDQKAALAYEEVGDIKTSLSTIKAAHDPVWMMVPVGSLEFANEILAAQHGRGPIKAINVPVQLQRPEWLGRRIVPDEVLDLGIFKRMQCGDLFVKPATYAKQFDAFRLTAANARQTLPSYEGQCAFVSETLPSPIVAEWRAFVYRGRIVDVRPYDLAEWVVPDRGVVQAMVSAYTDAPPAYTLDVAVLADGKTVVIEVHNFIGCGLYGFENRALMASMLSAAWQYELTH